jgi:GNAT superfamily N-acetyltransferase
VLEVAIADPESPEGQRLLAALSDALQKITGSSGTASFQVSDVQLEGACFVIARLPGGSPAGCGAIRPLQSGVAELKRMFAVPGSKGVGSAVLAFLERKARQFGYGQVWLETRKVNQRAVSFYERHGYRTIANFGLYVGRPEVICLGKLLPWVQAPAAEPQQPANPSIKGPSCGKPQAAPYLERWASQ